MHDNQRSNRRSRSGSRHRPNRGGRSSSHWDRESDGRSQASRPQTPVKLTFWQKVVSLFKGKPAAASSGRPASRSGGSGDRQGAPSQNGHRRFETGPIPASPRPPRKPEVIEVSSPKIYVGNLSFDATEGDLSELFNGVGKVQNAEIVSNKYTQKSKGFAFVTMLTVDEARRAVTELHDKEFMGRKLVVSGAKTNDNRDSREGRDTRESREPAESREAEAESPSTL